MIFWGIGVLVLFLLFLLFLKANSLSTATFIPPKNVKKGKIFEPAGYMPFFVRVSLSAFEIIAPRSFINWVFPLQRSVLWKQAISHVKKNGVKEINFELGDDAWIKRLDTFLLSVEDGSLNIFGRITAAHEARNGLQNRLFLNNFLLNYPQVRNQKIQKPIFIIGLPRTGSTYLQRLLSADERAESLKLWEGVRPIPSPFEAKELEKEPLTKTNYKKSVRCRQNSWEMMIFNIVGGFLAKLHETKSDEPEEDLVLFGLSFYSMAVAVTHNCEEFFSSLEQTTRKEREGILSLHKLQLQVLQWQRGIGREREERERGEGEREERERERGEREKGDEREEEERWWVLKSPCHIMFQELESLFDCYPDGTFIWTHRHPKDVLASALSLVANFHSTTHRVVDLGALTQSWTQKFSRAVDESLNIRKKYPNINIIDVSYCDLLKDPEQVVRDIYDTRGTEFSDEFQKSFSAVLSHYRKGKYGKHKYQLESFGLTPQHTQESFSNYLSFCKERNISLSF